MGVSGLRSSGWSRKGVGLMAEILNSHIVELIPNFKRLHFSKSTRSGHCFSLTHFYTGQLSL